MFLRWLWIQSPNKLISLLELKLDGATPLFGMQSAYISLEKRLHGVSPSLETVRFLIERIDVSAEIFLSCY